MIPEFSYASYVWSSYAIAAAVVLWQATIPAIKHRKLIAQIREDHALNESEVDQFATNEESR